LRGLFVWLSGVALCVSAVYAVCSMAFVWHVYVCMYVLSAVCGGCICYYC